MKEGEHIELSGTVTSVRVMEATPETIGVSFSMQTYNGYYTLYAYSGNVPEAKELKEGARVTISGYVTMDKYVFANKSVGYMPRIIVGAIRYREDDAPGETNKWAFKIFSDGKLISFELFNTKEEVEKYKQDFINKLSQIGYWPNIGKSYSIKVEQL